MFLAHFKAFNIFAMELIPSLVPYNVCLEASLVAQMVQKLPAMQDPGSGRFSGEGNGNPLQYSCLENPMDRGAWRGIVCGVSKSQTRLSDLTLHFSVFAYRIYNLTCHVPFHYKYNTHKHIFLHIFLVRAFQKYTQ